MHRTAKLSAAVLVALALASAVQAQGVDLPKPSVSEQEVRKAIRRGVEYLY